MKNLKYPLLLVVAFGVLLILNDQWAKTRAYSFYNDVENPVQPIREELKKDEFLSDEAHAQTFVINLWATWCAPCQKEIPKLNKLVQKYENEHTLFLAITAEKEDKVLDWIDLQKHEPAYFLLFNNQRLMNYIHSLNPDKSLKKGRAPEYLPTNLVIHNNEILFFEQGYSEEKIARLDSVLQTLN